MFERLGRYLRAAGYDAGIVGEGEPDDAVVAAVAREGRVLLTADRELAARVGRVGEAVLLPNGGAACVAFLKWRELDAALDGFVNTKWMETDGQLDGSMVQ